MNRKDQIIKKNAKLTHSSSKAFHSTKKQEEERLFHLLKFLSFVKNLKLNPFKDCKKLRIKKQFYYELKFPPSRFVKFTSMRLSHHFDQKKLIGYFKQLHKLDLIVKEFSDDAFQIYVCFSYRNFV